MLDRVLVVVDMQNDFVYGPLGNEDCRSAVRDVVDVITNGGFGLIVVTMDTHDEDYLSTQEGIRLPVEHCIEGTEGWELVPDVECALEESGAEVVITAKHEAFRMTHARPLRIFEDMTDSDIIGQVCSDHGINADLEETWSKSL